MIRNLVFDMGRVLTRFEPDEISAVFFEPEDTPAARREIFESPYWTELDRGTLTEETMIPLVCQRLPERLHGRAAELLLHWREHMTQMPDLVPLIHALRRDGYPLYLLSNAGISMLEFTHKLPVLRDFSGILFSAEVKLIKPDPRIYLAFFRRFSLAPQECFFIDDLPDNIRAGRDLGMEGFVYAGETEPLYRALREAGVSVGIETNPGEEKS